MRILACLGLLLGVLGCPLEPQGVPAGKVAVVGDVVFGPEDLSGVSTQLGPYAQLRFSGDEGRGALVEALVAAELMAQQAVELGLDRDPRVDWAIVEEEAALYLSAELERRLPRQQVAQDTEALRQWYDAHPDEFTRPEQRSLEGVVFDSFGPAEDALARLRAGQTTLVELGEPIATKLQVRDDAEHPGFHSLLFDPSLGPGDWLAAPIVMAGKVIVGRVQQVVDPVRAPFDDPAVQERLVHEVRSVRLVPVRDELLAELAERYPQTQPPG